MWLPTLAVLLGLAVVAGTAWLVFAPVTYDGPDGTVTCHSPTTANKQKVGYDGACQAPAIQRRWVVFAPLGLVGAAALVGLVAPGLRRRDEESEEPRRARRRRGRGARRDPARAERRSARPTSRPSPGSPRPWRSRTQPQSTAAPYTSSSAPTGSKADRSTSSSNSATASAAGGAPTLATATRPIAGEM